MWAILGGHQEIVQIFLQIENINVDQQNKDGKTALMLASQEGQHEIVQMLLLIGNINFNQEQDNNGQTKF